MFIRFACVGLLVAAVIFGGRFLREFATEIRDVRQHAQVRSVVLQASPTIREAERTVPVIENDGHALHSVQQTIVVERPVQSDEVNETTNIEPVPESSSTVSVRHPGHVDTTDILPGNFEYLGAIRPPHVDGLSSSFSYGGSVIAHNPQGDPDGDDDGFPGSLFLSGHIYQQEVAELSIPRPILSPDSSLDVLGVCTLLQPFGDVSDGIMKQMTEDESQPFQLGGLQVVGDALHWTMYRYYNVEGYDFLSHGLSSVNLRNPYPLGPWHLGPWNSGSSQWHAYKHAGHIAEVPESTAVALGGRRWVSGLQISTGLQTSSQGPALFAYQLPQNAAPQGSSLDAVPLLWYSMEQPLDQHHPADSWTGVAWLQAGDRQTVVFTGRKATGPVYYGEGRPKDCNDNKGYHGPPYEAQALFYDADDLLAVARGERYPWDVVPIYRWTNQSAGGGLTCYTFPTCQQDMGGLAYDRANNLLYLVQMQAGVTQDSPYKLLPVIHVFRVAG